MPPEATSRRWFHGVELSTEEMGDCHKESLEDKLADIKGDFVVPPVCDPGPCVPWSDELVDQVQEDSAVAFVRAVWGTHGSLLRVLHAAAAQSALGKGLERHGSRSVPFTDQPVLRLVGLLGPSGVNGPLYQALKKIQEAAGFLTRGVDKARLKATVELLGAIVYLGAAVIALEKESQSE